MEIWKLEINWKWKLKERIIYIASQSPATYIYLPTSYFELALHKTSQFLTFFLIGLDSHLCGLGSMSEITDSKAANAVIQQQLMQNEIGGFNFDNYTR